MNQGGAKRSDRMRVVVYLEPRLWWEIADDAEAAGVRVADVVEGWLVCRPTGGVAETVTPARPVGSLYAEFDIGARIPLLVHDGFDDGAISRATGKTRQYVATVRRRAGLKANRPLGWFGKEAAS